MARVSTRNATHVKITLNINNIISFWTCLGQWCTFGACLIKPNWFFWSGWCRPQNWLFKRRGRHSSGGFVILKLSLAGVILDNWRVFAQNRIGSLNFRMFQSYWRHFGGSWETTIGRILPKDTPLGKRNFLLCGHKTWSILGDIPPPIFAHHRNGQGLVAQWSHRKIEAS